MSSSFTQKWQKWTFQSGKAFIIYSVLYFDKAGAFFRWQCFFLQLTYNSVSSALQVDYVNSARNQVCSCVHLTLFFSLLPEFFFCRKERIWERKKPLVVWISLSCYDRCQSTSRDRLTWQFCNTLMFDAFWQACLQTIKWFDHFLLFPFPFSFFFLKIILFSGYTENDSQDWLLQDKRNGQVCGGT